MKRILPVLFYVLGIFLIVSMLILPEYRGRAIIAFLIYLIFLVLVIRATAKQELLSFYYSIFSARFKYMLSGLLVFILMTLVAISFLHMGIFNTKKMDLTTKGSVSVSASSIQYLEHLDKDVEVVYVRPINSEDYKSYFNAIMEEMNNHNGRVTYHTVHPVLNTMEYNELKNRISTLVPGNFVVISGKNYLVGERINEKEIIRTINRVVNGDVPICYSMGHGEPDLNDFSEKGGAIMYGMLQNRGVTLIPVDSKEWNKCRVIMMAEPLLDLKEEEISTLDKFEGAIVLFGGTGLASIKKLLSGNGINISDRQRTSFKDYALRDYDGGSVLDRFYDHPVLSGIKGGVVMANGHPINCKECINLAGIEDSIMYAGKGKILLFSGEKSSTNFFMRFNGNLKLIYNALLFSFSPDDYLSFIDDKNDEVGLFAVSPRFLNIIFWVCVFGVPMLLLLLGVYCFKSTRVQRTN